MAGEAQTIQSLIRDALTTLTAQVSSQAGISPRQIGGAAIVGNTAMHHLLLGIDPKSLTVPPYMPTVSQGLSIPAEPLLDIAPGAQIRLLPNIAGFVGEDTVGGLFATRFDRQTLLTLMIDIGTNGEMVLGIKDRAVACSTAAGPAFAGAKIQCGMRGQTGAVDHVWLENGIVRYSVIGDGPTLGLCGSGLLDLVAVLLDKIQPIGNAAGEGAKLYALSQQEFAYSQTLAESTEFLELASLAEFNDCYVDCLCFSEEE